MTFVPWGSDRGNNMKDNFVTLLGILFVIGIVVGIFYASTHGFVIDDPRI